MSSRSPYLTASDIRQTPQYREAQRCFEAIRQPGSGQVSDATELHVAADGSRAVFTGIIFDAAANALLSHICHVDLANGQMDILTSGTHTDRLPKISGDGAQVAFLSDRHKEGDFQLHFLDLSSGAVRAAPPVEGWVEYLHWSPDGRRILLGVAGHGADLSGAQGAVASKELGEDGAPDWMPSVDTGDESYKWRHAWIYDLATDAVQPAGPVDVNVWEAVWCGDNALAAVISDGPGEGLWYHAHLALLDLAGDSWRSLYRPKDQLGWPAASPDGRQLAVVEAVCSDRWIVAGDLRLIDVASGAVREIATDVVDITYVDWRSADVMQVAGHRGLDTVVGLLDSGSGQYSESWASAEIGAAGRYANVSGFGASGDFAFLAEGFTRAPEIAVVRSGVYHSARSFDLGYGGEVVAIGGIEARTWRADDGLELQGWLLRPKGDGPYPLVMNIHGGPVLNWHATWLGRSRLMPLCLLLQHGYAVFLPNPRGSSGRGQDFARQVVGDMGGADMGDLLTGLDHLVDSGIADPKRLGTTGVSYGGFMSSWLITQDQRFAAAVPIAPITNHVTEHLLSNIPHFEKLFVADDLTNLGGRYFQTSPVLHAHKVTTPTLNIAGGMDRCTPPQEAMQFHRLLQENGATSVLVLYPEEGHGIHGFPAAIDFAARLVDWFEYFMPSKGAG